MYEFKGLFDTFILIGCIKAISKKKFNKLNFS